MQGESRREEEKEQNDPHIKKELEHDAAERALIDGEEIQHPSRRRIPKQSGGKKQHNRYHHPDNESAQ